MENLVNLFGRLHPLLVHLPIGILIRAFLFDCLSLFRRYKKLSIAVQPALFWGGLSAIASAISGYFISQEGGYAEKTLFWHQYAGIATATLAVALYFLRRNPWLLKKEKEKRKPIRLLLFVPVIILLSITGHLGGSLTHGEGFLTEFIPYNSEKKVDPISKIKAIKDVREAILYSDVIQPILDSKCYSCHSSKKHKGDLRLDAISFILNGGKHGRVILEGKADSSSLYKRLVLPLEDKHHMPPDKEQQPSAVEIDLIHFWLAEGASFEKKVGPSLKAELLIKTLIESSHQENWMPIEKVTAASEDLILNLRESGALVLPVSMDNNYISVSFINSRVPGKKILTQLLPLSDQLVSLSLSHCKVSASDLSALNQLTNLVWLHLDDTNVNDSIASMITSLSKLKYLNLVHTAVSNESLNAISNMKELKEIFLFQTNTTKDGIKQLRAKLPSIKIDTGNYTLTKLASDTLVYKQKPK